jgi:hypothetical protein
MAALCSALVRPGLDAPRVTALPGSSITRVASGLRLKALRILEMRHHRCALSSSYAFGVLIASALSILRVRVISTVLIFLLQISAMVRTFWVSSRAHEEECPFFPYNSP